LNDHQFQIISGFSLIGNLRELSLDNNPGVSETLWASLFVDDSFLRVVSLRGNGITDVGAKGIANALKTNRTLFSLNLFDNKIQKTGAEYFGETLKANSTLQTLSLGKNNIGDDGLLSLITVFISNPGTFEYPIKCRGSSTAQKTFN
jgi:Ran GTPase-activating protein (RanGAP) involved in mRNA processing and transport